MEYYVYVYMDPLKKCHKTFDNISYLYEPFYIGKGKNSRYITHLTDFKLNKDNFLSRKIKKLKKLGYDPYVVKIYENISEEESHIIERNLISLIGRRCFGSGTLVNITDGGEGVSGLKHTKESRRKMSLKGENHPNWGKHLKESTRKKISEALKINNPMSNPEVVEKVRLQNLGREPWNKGLKTPYDVRVKQSIKKIKYTNIKAISKENGEIIEFDNAKEVMIFLERTHRMVMIYFKKGESRDYWWKFDKA